MISGRRQACARGGKPHSKCRLAPTMKHKPIGKVSIGIVRNFQILIVFAVKICKQCLLQIPARLAGLRPWTSLGGGVRLPDRLGYSPQNEDSWRRYC